MSKEIREWRRGAPPYTGWWNASVNRDIAAWRWWDGACWSSVAWSRDNGTKAGWRASIKANISTMMIEWTSYWPENARVPRNDPLKYMKGS